MSDVPVEPPPVEEPPAPPPEPPPVDQNWVIVNAAGDVIDQVITSGTHPRFHGYPWDGATMTAHMTDRQGDLTLERFDVATLAWVMVAAEAEAVALARIDARQDLAFGQIARQTVVFGELQTWREIQDLKRITDPEVSAMTPAQRQARWPFLIALMTESGTALANFRAFATTAETELAPRVARVATLSARALLGRREIKAAITAEAKLAAAERKLED